MFKKPWLVWVVIAIGYIINPVWWVAHWQNCHLVECSWFRPLQAFFAVVAFILAIVWWVKTDKATRGNFVSFLNGAVFLVIIHMFLNGIGQLGPDACPSIDPQCGTY
jgi:hypothetical protein